MTPSRANVDAGAARAALRQQLEADRLLGLKSIPISLQPPRTGNSGRVHPDPEGAADATRKAQELRVLDESSVKGCTKCALCETRTQTVFGQGAPNARLAFVGEAPGFEEDRQGLAFVGRAGKLLTRMIAAMGLARDEVYICNVLKCRPPGNRDPSAEEVLACSPYLQEQLTIIQPEVLVALGAPAAKTVLNTTQSIGRLRGRFHDYYPGGVASGGGSIPVMPTYHPAYLLRNPAEKRKAWDDLQMVMHLLGLPVPDRKPA